MAPDLFPELIMEILNRLPVRDRARFRCICKSWCTLISHLSLERIPSFLVCSYYFDDPNDRQFPVNIRFSSYDIQRNLLKQFEKKFSGFMDPLYTCLEYVCLVGQFTGPVCLCNPTTEEFIALPDFQTYTMGFGFAASTKEFKLLQIHESTNRCEVITVGTLNHWREVESPPFSLLPYQHGIFVNGSIHMLPHSDTVNRGVHDIAFFNLDQEEWGQVAVPPIYKTPYEVVLRETRGCLCLVVRDGKYKERHMEIWLFKNFEWVKDYNFDLPPLLDSEYAYNLNYYFGIMLVDDDGGVILIVNREGTLFRVKCNTSDVREYKSLSSESISGVSLFLESFLSFERLHASDKQRLAWPYQIEQHGAA